MTDHHDLLEWARRTGGELRVYSERGNLCLDMEARGGYSRSVMASTPARLLDVAASVIRSDPRLNERRDTYPDELAWDPNEAAE